MPIPVKGCTHWLEPEEHGKRTGWCRCIWAPVLEEPSVSEPSQPDEALTVMQSSAMEMVRCAQCAGFTLLGNNCSHCGCPRVVHMSLKLSS